MKFLPIITFLLVNVAHAGDIQFYTPKGLDTLYVPVTIGNVTEYYLFDTGAGRMTITEETLATIREITTVTSNGKLEGHLGDGTIITVNKYIIESMTVGDSCTVKNVEVAVLPGASRGLFGLSALRQAGDFTMSFTNNKVTFNNC